MQWDYESSRLKSNTLETTAGDLCVSAVNIFKYIQRRGAEHWRGQRKIKTPPLTNGLKLTLARRIMKP
jgi:hypothetical protein